MERELDIGIADLDNSCFRAERDIARMEDLLDQCKKGPFFDIDDSVLSQENNLQSLSSLMEIGIDPFAHIRSMLDGLQGLKITDELLLEYPRLKFIAESLTKAASAYVGIDSLATGLTMLFKIDPERAMERAKEMLKDYRFVAPMVFTVVNGFCGREELQELYDLCLKEDIRLQGNLPGNFGLAA